MGLLTDWTDGSRAHRIVVRESLPAGLPKADYVDAFAVTRPAVEDERSPELLAREAIEGAASAARAVIRLAWRVLGFRLGPANSPAHVFGWRVLRSDGELIEIAADGPRAASRILIATTARKLWPRPSWR